MKRAEHLTIAEGFLDIGMADEAWAELDEIEPMERAHPSVIAMRLRILQRMGRFETGVKIARGAVRLHPEDLDEPPPTPGLRREGSRGDEKGNS